jgi:hypothetical protein
MDKPKVQVDVCIMPDHRYVEKDNETVCQSRLSSSA